MVKNTHSGWLMKRSLLFVVCIGVFYATLLPLAHGWFGWSDDSDSSSSNDNDTSWAEDVYNAVGSYFDADGDGSMWTSNGGNNSGYNPGSDYASSLNNAPISVATGGVSIGRTGRGYATYNEADKASKSALDGSCSDCSTNISYNPFDGTYSFSNSRNPDSGNGGDTVTTNIVTDTSIHDSALLLYATPDGPPHEFTLTTNAIVEPDDEAALAWSLRNPITNEIAEASSCRIVQGAANGFELDDVSNTPENCPDQVNFGACDNVGQGVDHNITEPLNDGEVRLFQLACTDAETGIERFSNVVRVTKLVPVAPAGSCGADQVDIKVDWQFGNDNTWKHGYGVSNPSDPVPKTYVQSNSLPPMYSQPFQAGPGVMETLDIRVMWNEDVGAIANLFVVQGAPDESGPWSDVFNVSAGASGKEGGTRTWQFAWNDDRELVSASEIATTRHALPYVSQDVRNTAGKTWYRFRVTGRGGFTSKWGNGIEMMGGASIAAHEADPLCIPVASDTTVNDINVELTANVGNGSQSDRVVMAEDGTIQNLTLTAPDATSCTITSGGSFGFDAVDITDGGGGIDTTINTPPLGPHTFAVLCEDASGNTGRDNVQITVQALPASAELQVSANEGRDWTSRSIVIGGDEEIQLRWRSENAVSCEGSNFSTEGQLGDGDFAVQTNVTGPELYGDFVQYTVLCRNAAGTPASDSLAVSYGGDFSISADPIVVRADDDGDTDTTITWDVGSHTDCVLEGPGLTSGPVAVSGSESVDLAHTGVYTLTCGGVVTGVEVNVLGPMFEQ